MLACARLPEPSDLQFSPRPSTDVDDDVDEKDATDEEDDEDQDDEDDESANDDDDAAGERDEDEDQDPNPPTPDAGAKDSGAPLVVVPKDAASATDPGGADAGTGAPNVRDAAADPQVDAGTPTQPNATCTPGVYSGDFLGQMDGLLLRGPANISGKISIQVALAPGGNALQIQNGSIQGADQDGNQVSARVTGTMNCATRQMENGQLTDGVYRRLIVQARFSGTVIGTQRDNPLGAAGTWEVRSETGLHGGNGTWSVTLE